MSEVGTIQIRGWDRDTDDHLGKEQREVFYVSVNGGREKALSKAALLSAIKTILPERAAEDARPPAAPAFIEHAGARGETNGD